MQRFIATPRGTLIALLCVSVVFLILGAFLNPPISSDWIPWVGAQLISIATGVIGGCVAFAMVDLNLKAREAREAEESRRLEAQLVADAARADQLLRAIGRLRSGSVHEAKLAVFELREKGWLEDGSLTGADLRGAVLSTLDLSGSVLRRVDLRGVSLRQADLTGADLRAANLIGADIEGARTDGAMFGAE